MKNTIKFILQKLLGFRRYLIVFSRFKIATLRFDKKEGDFLLFMQELEDGKGVILDIGANIGIMTTSLSRNFPKSRIHAVEPLATNWSILEANIAYYKLANVELHQVAVGETEGEITMILPSQGKTKLQGLSHVKHASITEWNDGEEFQVPVTTLDKLFGDEKIQGIKMDVENFEFFALRGANKILSKQKPLLYLELWENENRTKCFDWLDQLGYSPFVVEQKRWVPYQPQKHKGQNFLFRAMK